MEKILENPNIQINAIKSNSENMWYDPGHDDETKTNSLRSAGDAHSSYTTRYTSWQ